MQNDSKPVVCNFFYFYYKRSIMKQLLFALLLIVACPVITMAQCSIYADDQTGAFGAGFNNDNKPTTMQECVDLAKKMCKDKGGKNCTLLDQSVKTGWYALISGTKADGRIYFQGGSGYSTKREAEEAVRKKYKDGGGANADGVEVVTWYAYANPKN